MEARAERRPLIGRAEDRITSRGVLLVFLAAVGILGMAAASARSVFASGLNAHTTLRTQSMSFAEEDENEGQRATLAPGNEGYICSRAGSRLCFVFSRQVWA